MTLRKPLEELNLMDRFLFAEAMEDPVIFEITLHIILENEIVLKSLPQSEKEQRTSPLYRYIKLDVWAQDTDDTIYNTEVQQKNTQNLPRRSRYYQGMIDSKLLEPGTIDFNQLNNVFLIIISPFDLFGKDKYMYTFQMTCKEVPEMELGDGAVRIFLNTRGKNDNEVNPELVELLKYMESTTKKTAAECKSSRIKTIQKHIDLIKSNKEVGVKYMQEWEERELYKLELRAEAMAEGRAEGLAEGKAKGLAEGKAKGLAEGKAKGLAEGKAKGLAEAVLSILSESDTVPEHVKETITSQTDPDLLKDWLKTALKSDSIEHFISKTGI